jgi:predicted acylesterase/phospholipase RssA
MTYKVAIAISGAVSLGSYEAGTMYEIINAIKAHNESNPAHEHIHIDVLTGASAGGMTAALTTQKLLYDANALHGEYSNAGYLAWVKQVHIDGLLKPHDLDNDNTSILSSGFVDSIAQNLIMGRYQTTENPSQDRHIASAKEIKLGLALSNLNGVDYSQDIFESTHAGLEDGSFVETRHQDRLTLTLGEEQDKEKLWKRIASTSRACGAFPGAFSPVSLFRRFDEPDYQGRGCDDFTRDGAERKFTYIDGGAFNNYPLGMARELAKTIDTDPLDYQNRFYFYISPSKKVSGMDTTLDGDSPDFKMHNVALSSIKAIFSQARFQDWLMTDKVNRKIDLLDKRALELAKHVKGSSKTAVKRLATSAKELCEALYIEVSTDDESMEAALLRLATQYREDFKDFEAATQEEKDAWIYSIAVLEKSANLNDRDIMNVYTITAKSDELASEQLMSFMGFFDEKYRHYDYVRGRLNATKVILHILNSRQDADKSDSHLPLKLKKSQYVAQERTLSTFLNSPHLGNVTPADVEKTTRVRVYERIKDRYFLIAKNAGMGWMLRTALFNFFIKGKVKDALKLD